MGAAECLSPVIRALSTDKNLVVDVFADDNGAGKKELAKANITFTLWKEGDAIDLTGVDTIVCGTAVKAKGLLRAATTIAKAAGVKIIWVGDYFASGSEQSLLDITPHHMSVIDDATAELFLVTHPGFEERNVHVLGNPKYDLLADFDRESARSAGRVKLGLPPAKKAFVYAASSLAQNDAKATLDIIVEYVLAEDASLVVTFHPDDRMKRPDDIADIELLLTELIGDRYHRVPDGVSITNEQLAALADVFFTDFSQTGVLAMLIGTPTAFIILAKASEHLAKLGLTKPYFPILDQGKMETTPAIAIFAKEGAAERLAHLLAPGEQEERAFTISTHFEELGGRDACFNVSNLIRSSLP
jgi:hypothetical protein